jgi:tetratricopeptide (TPR) repeat protein
VAQEIVRAKAPAARAKPPLRLVVLGSLAVLLAAGLGSVLMGWWGDPVNWIQSAGLASPSTVRPAAPMVASRLEPVTVSPVVSDVPVVSDAPNRPVVPKGARSASATPATREPPDSVVSPASSRAVAKPSTPPKAATALVQSRTAGPSPLELGYAALVEGRLPAAAQAYGQALLANPEERDALLGLAYIAHQQGRIEEARGYYQGVLRQDPGNAIARSGLLTTNAVDDPQVVASRAREVAEQNPDSAAAHSALGHAMVREGRLADAQQAFFRAHSLEPGVALHAFNLAVSLDRLRNFGPARQYYERALVLSAQTGGERPSGVPQAAVQTRLDQLRAAMAVNPTGAARE